MGSQSRKTTIDEIAKAAGVSKATVSRYINGKYDIISKSTQERIQKVIEITGYQPNDVARLLRSNETKRIGVIIADITTPFSSALMSGINEVLDAAGYVPLFVNADNDFDKETTQMKAFLARGVDGLLVNSCAYHNLPLIEASCKGVPIVLCDRLIADHNFSIVTTNADDFISNTLAHLKEEGYSTPFLFTQALNQSSTRQIKHDLFLEKLPEYFDVPAPNANVRFIDINDMASTCKQIEHILKTTKEEATAFIGMNTVTTLHILSALKQLNVEVPKSVGVCGPDDWSWGQQMEWANLISPGITTIVIPSHEIGHLAAEQLLQKIKNPEQPNKTVELSCDLVVRSSTKRS